MAAIAKPKPARPRAEILKEQIERRRPTIRAVQGEISQGVTPENSGYLTGLIEQRARQYAAIEKLDALISATRNRLSDLPGALKRLQEAQQADIAELRRIEYAPKLDRLAEVRRQIAELEALAGTLTQEEEPQPEVSSAPVLPEEIRETSEPVLELLPETDSEVAELRQMYADAGEEIPDELQ